MRAERAKDIKMKICIIAICITIILGITGCADDVDSYTKLEDSESEDVAYLHFVGNTFCIIINIITSRIITIFYP